MMNDEEKQEERKRGRAEKRKKICVNLYNSSATDQAAFI